MESSENKKVGSLSMALKSMRVFFKEYSSGASGHTV
jgi:hypothetical protein